MIRFFKSTTLDEIPSDSLRIVYDAAVEYVSCMRSGNIIETDALCVIHSVISRMPEGSDIANCCNHYLESQLKALRADIECAQKGDDISAYELADACLEADMRWLVFAEKVNEMLDSDFPAVPVDVDHMEALSCWYRKLWIEAFRAMLQRLKKEHR